MKLLFQNQSSILTFDRIPFERALDFANKEKITDLLYPLFVHNIGGLLYNPENAPRTNAVVAATERRRVDSIDSTRPPQSAQTPTLQHHHSMQSNIGGQAPPTPHAISQHQNAGRPSIDRAHTFPTPPTSASSVMGGMGSQGSSYEWGNQPMTNGVNGTQPLSIDTMNARSMPTTPATTPPGNQAQGMQSYQGQQAYDNKGYYNTTPSSQTGYAQHSDGNRYSQPLPSYGKTDMGPPNAPGGSAPGSDTHDHKSDYSQVHPQSHPSEHDSADHHDGGYMHASTAAYGPPRTQYGYNPASDHPHLSPEMSGSPSHQTPSGRGTPRTMPTAQQQWSQDYQTPPRPGGSNVYNVVGSSRTSNGAGSGDNYASSSYSNSSHGAGMASVKRGREDDDQDGHTSREYDMYGAKRQKTGRQDTFGMPLNTPPHMQAIKTGGQR